MVLPPPKADMEHSQAPQSGIQDTCRLNIGGGEMDKLPKRRNEILTAHLLQEWGGAIGINKVTPSQEKATTQRTVGGKFFDSTDGKCSTVSAQDYDEQIEREVAENIIDWWVSKKSYKQWYADKFLQKKLNFEENNE